MIVDYNKFWKTFSNSRKNMKWEEIYYFFDFIKKNIDLVDDLKILDIWSWNWRLISHILDYWLISIDSLKNNYLWIDLSQVLLNEAVNNNLGFKFKNLNMLNLDSLVNNFDMIFSIASFHHLYNIEERLDFLSKLYSITNTWWYIFFTNWALNSYINLEKYKNSILQNTKNHFWWIDYKIKIWDNHRFYHCFSISELDYLFKKSGFTIIENRLFENNRNFISILKK